MQILAAILFVPFFGWGLYTLQRRFQFQEECSPVVEISTMLGIVLFLTIEINQLQIWLSSSPLTYIFTVLSLIVSSAALYGHLAISFCSRMVVDFISPSDEYAQDIPRFGPAEILEHEEDYEGALQEYLVLARIFPRNPEIMTRIAENLLRLSRYEEWLDCMMKTLKLLAKDKDCKPLLAHVCGVYERELEDEGTLISTLNTLIERHPDTLLSDTAKYHLKRIATKGEVHHASTLQAMHESSLEDMADSDDASRDTSRSAEKRTLLALEDDVMPEIQDEHDLSASPEDSTGSEKMTAALAPLEEVDIAEEESPPEEPSPPKKKKSSGLEAM